MRPLRRDDAAQLAALSAAIGAAEKLEDWRRILARTAGGGAIAIGAQQGEELVGYATGEVRTAFGLPEPSGWLECFGVSLDSRGHGVGRALAAALLDGFRQAGAARVYTVVTLHDPAMTPFLREIGFREQALSCLGRAL